MQFDASVAEALARLYSNPVAAVQEILANAVAACKSAAEVHGADPHIRVAIDGRNLTIEDVDSLGMPWRVFKDTYAVAGKSLKVGGDPGSKPGLFGCGSFSYTLVSDIMFVETHARTTGERYSVMACDGKGFQTGLKEPTFDWYGTRIRMTIRRSVAMRDVLQRVCDVSDMCGVRIAVECSGLEADDVPNALLDRADHGGGGGNDAPMAHDDWIDGGVDALAPFRAEIGGTGMSEMIAGHLDELSTYPPPAVAARIRAENKDMEVVAQWAVDSRGYAMDIDRNRTWLAGMPIGDVHADDRGCGECYPRRAGWHSRTMWIHCKSERVYRPTPDRERFPYRTAQKVAADANALIFGRVKCIRPRSLPEYLADGSNRVLEMALPDTEGALDERHKRIARAASCAVAHSYKDGIGGGDGGTTTLWDALYPGAPACRAGGAQKLDGEPLLVVCDRLNRHRDAAIAAHAGASGAQRGPVVVFRPAGGPGTRKDDFVDLGCVDADEYVRLHGISVRPGPDDAEQGRNDDGEGAAAASAAARKARQGRSASAAKSTDLVLHYGDVGEVRRGVLVPRMASMRAAPGALHGTVVRCTAGGEFDAMRRTLAALVCNTTFVTRTSRAVPGTIGFGEYAAAAGRRAYATSGGTMSGSEIAGDGRKAVLVEYNAADGGGADGGGKIDRCSGLAALLGDSEDVLFVVGRTDDLSACAAHLWSAGTAACTVWMLPFYALSYNRADLARREYLGDIAELEDSPMKAADYWLRAAAAGIRPDWNRRARSSAAEMLHSHLAGRALLRKAGIMYGSGSDEDEGEDGGEDRICRAEGEAQCPE